MMRVLPDWYTKGESRFKDLIYKIALENQIPIDFIEDSKTIEDSISNILMRLVNLDELVDVENRERLKEFVKKIQPKNETSKSKSKGRKKKTIV